VVTQPAGWQPANPLAGGRRLARAAVLGGATYGLAVGAHVVGGGGLPGWSVGVMLTAVLGVLGLAGTARRLRLPTLLGTLALSQAALHVLFALLEAPATSCSVSEVSHHAATAMCGPSAAAATMLVPALPMLLAHGGATVATAWVLARGEAWLWRTLRRVLTVPVPPALLTTAQVSAVDRDGLGLVTTWVRPDAPRGPPRLPLLLVS
jgi:hypothetical protein